MRVECSWTHRYNLDRRVNTYACETNRWMDAVLQQLPTTPRQIQALYADLLQLDILHDPAMPHKLLIAHSIPQVKGPVALNMLVDHMIGDFRQRVEQPMMRCFTM